jgi:hypothetical protein
MGEDSIPKSSATLLHLNVGEIELEEDEDDYRYKFEHDENGIYIVQFNDVQYQELDSTNEVYVFILMMMLILPQFVETKRI